MANRRKKFSPEEKVRLLHLHLIEKDPVSDICDRHGLNPNVFYKWQKQFLENGAAAFAQSGNGRKDSYYKTLENKISKLQAKRKQALQRCSLQGIANSRRRIVVGAASNRAAIPFYELQRQFRALLCLKKPPCRRQSLNLEMDLSNSC